MFSKSINLLLLLLSLQMLVPVHEVLADTGPKPTMEFTFKQELTGEPLTIVSGILYECDQPDCSDAAPLEDVGPQGLYCELQSCRAIGYGFASYHQLEIEFSDDISRQSNIFETAGFDSKYTVTVRPDDLLVEARFNLLPSFSLGILEVITCICTLVGEVLIVGLIILSFSVLEGSDLLASCNNHHGRCSWACIFHLAKEAAPSNSHYVHFCKPDHTIPFVDCAEAFLPSLFSDFIDC